MIDHKITLFSFQPGYCPSCGKEIRLRKDCRAEFWNGVSQQCLNCGLIYQLAQHQAMLECAKVNGDMAQFVTV